MLNSFRGAPPARQLIVIAGIGLVLCALLFGAYFAFFRTSYDVLYRNLREADAATIVAELDRTHVDYRLEDGGRTIMVARGAVDSTRLHVAGRDLPLQGTVGFELFNSQGIGLTEFAQRINLQRALQGELARTIMSIDGVEAARVHLSLGEQTAFRGDRRPPRASVSVRTRPGRALTPTTVRGIQRLISGSVPEMDPASVAVLNDRGALVSADVSGEAALAPADEERRRIERFFELRIRRAVEARFPSRTADVNVWAGLGEDGPRRGGEPNAEARDYRLRATVAISAPLGVAAREQLAATVRDSIGFSEALGDAVSVTASAPVAAGEPWSPEATPMPPPDKGQAETGRTAPSLLASLWTPFLVLLLIGAMVVLLRRRGAGGARMGERERIALTDNLKTLLARREADAAPPA
jgi:flagellar M-ring protein FliF